jgi:hypothetical protein
MFERTDDHLYLKISSTHDSFRVDMRLNSGF